MSAAVATQPTGIALKQAASLFEAIASKAGQIDRLCFFNGPDSGAEQVQLALELVRDLVNQMGWMADLGSAKLDAYGGGPVRGNSEKWLLSPHYDQLEEVRE